MGINTKLQTDIIKTIKPEQCYVAVLFAIGSLIINHRPICNLLKEGLTFQNKNLIKLNYSTIKRLFPTLEKKKPNSLAFNYKPDINNDNYQAERPYWNYNIIGRIKRIKLLILILENDVQPMFN